MYKQCRYNIYTMQTVEVLLTLLVSNSLLQYWGLTLNNKIQTPFLKWLHCGKQMPLIPPYQKSMY